MPPLDNPRRERFAMLVANGISPGEAHVRAGYMCRDMRNARHTASRLRRKPDVAARIKELSAAITDGAVAAARNWLGQPLMDKAETLARLQAIARADIRKALAWGAAAFEKDGEALLGKVNFAALLDSGALDDATASAIAEVIRMKDGTVRLRLHDKQTALRDYARLQGWLPQRHELGGAEGAPVTFTIKVGDDRGGGSEN